VTSSNFYRKPPKNYNRTTPSIVEERRPIYTAHEGWVFSHREESVQ